MLKVTGGKRYRVLAIYRRIDIQLGNINLVFPVEPMGGYQTDKDKHVEAETFNVKLSRSDKVIQVATIDSPGEFTEEEEGIICGEVKKKMEISLGFCWELDDVIIEEY